jgi:hypothetical protein
MWDIQPQGGVPHTTTGASAVHTGGGTTDGGPAADFRWDIRPQGQPLVQPGRMRATTAVHALEDGETEPIAMDHTNLPASVFNIVRDAIQAGFINGITLDDFNAELSVLTPAESEDYVHALSRQRTG